MNFQLLFFLTEKVDISISIGVPKSRTIFEIKNFFALMIFDQKIE